MTVPRPEVGPLLSEPHARPAPPEAESWVPSCSPLPLSRPEYARHLPVLVLRSRQAQPGPAPARPGWKPLFAAHSWRFWGQTNRPFRTWDGILRIDQTYFTSKVKSETDG